MLELPGVFGGPPKPGLELVDELRQLPNHLGLRQDDLDQMFSAQRFKRCPIHPELESRTQPDVKSRAKIRGVSNYDLKDALC